MSAISCHHQLPHFTQARGDSYCHPRLYTLQFGPCRPQSRAIRPMPKRRRRPQASSSLHKPTLPIELYGSIFEHINDRDALCRLALTSHTCRREAERILYSHITLDGDIQRLESWSLAMLENPSKAGRVRTLTMPFDVSFLIVPDMVLRSLGLIARALHALPNLKSLTLLGHNKVMMNPLYSWMLDGCSFRLEKFHNAIFPTCALIHFLSEQTCLQQWTQTCSMVDQPSASSFNHLSNLSVLRGNASLLNGFSTRPPLERVSLQLLSVRDSEGDRNLVESLTALGSSITALHLERMILGTGCIPSPKFLSLLARHLPNLEILIFGQRQSIYEHGAAIHLSSQSLQYYQELIPQFPKLRGFWLTSWDAHEGRGNTIQAETFFSRNCHLESLSVSPYQRALAQSFTKNPAGVINHELIDNDHDHDIIEDLTPWWH